MQKKYGVIFLRENEISYFFGRNSPIGAVSTQLINIFKITLFRGWYNATINKHWHVKSIRHKKQNVTIVIFYRKNWLHVPFSIYLVEIRHHRSLSTIHWYHYKDTILRLREQDKNHIFAPEINWTEKIVISKLAKKLWG